MLTKLPLSIAALCFATISSSALSLNSRARAADAYFTDSDGRIRRIYIDEPRSDRDAQDRAARDRDPRSTRGDLTASMSRLHDAITRMNTLLHSYGRDSYGRLKDELGGLNSQVDAFQNLVDHRESNRVLRDAFIKVEQAAAAIDVHVKGMNASRSVNEAWQTVGDAYHRVSDDINYRSASER